MSMQKEKRIRERVEGMCVNTTEFAPLMAHIFRGPVQSQLFRSAFVSCEKHANVSVHRSFNKQETEFPSKSQYDDYLEEKEDISTDRCL